jgi:hypothetical protein
VPAFPTAAIGLFGLVSGPAVARVPCAAGARRHADRRATGAARRDGPGPAGGAFFLWDKALKLGDARHIGILSYITPLASTTLLIVVSGRALQLEHRPGRRC